MGYPTKVQLIQRKAGKQWYVNFPAAIAHAIEFQRGETVEWLIEDKTQLVLRRLDPPPSAPLNVSNPSHPNTDPKNPTTDPPPPNSSPFSDKNSSVPSFRRKPESRP